MPGREYRDALMVDPSLQDKSVRELQDLVREAPVAIKKQRKPLSRAARLHLIDMLSRWSDSGLALIAGVSVFLAITVGRAYPARAAAWGLMMIGALWVCRRLRSQFRAGNAISSRPFRWRASYTSCLSVLGVILASAPILLTPAAAPAPMLLQVAGLMIFAALGAALLHSAHLPTALAVAAPAAFLAILTGLRSGETLLIAASAMTALLCISAVCLCSDIIAKKAGRSHPRTTFLRRETHRKQDRARGRGALGPAAHSA